MLENRKGTRNFQDFYIHDLFKTYIRYFEEMDSYPTLKLSGTGSNELHKNSEPIAKRFF